VICAVSQGSRYVGHWSSYGVWPGLALRTGESVAWDLPSWHAGPCCGRWRVTQVLARRTARSTAGQSSPVLLACGDRGT